MSLVKLMCWDFALSFNQRTLSWQRHLAARFAYFTTRYLETRAGDAACLNY